MDRLTKDQAVVIMGFTGVTTVSFGVFHEDVEKRLGHPVLTHQFIDKGFADKLKELYRDDFVKLAYGEENK